MATRLVLNGIDLNPTASRFLGSAPYRAMEPIDWGGAAIAQVIRTGDFQAAEYDAVLTSGRVLRQITIPLRIQGPTKDALLGFIQQLQVSLDQASRLNPVPLYVEPTGGFNPATFQIVGGSLDDSNLHDNTMETQNFVKTALHLEALPFAYGQPQQLGSASAPLASGESPVSLVVRPTPGMEGDVPADVTIYVSATQNAYAPGAGTGMIRTQGLDNAIVATANDNQLWRTWTDSSEWNLYTTSGIGVLNDGRFKNSHCVQFNSTGNATNTIYNIASVTLGPNDLPAGQPIRMLMRVLDQDTTAGTRGTQQFRLQLQTGLTTVLSDWMVAPPQALYTLPNGNQTGACCLVDMGAFTVPVAPMGSGGQAQTTVTVQYQCSNASLKVCFDYILFLPDDQSMIAEGPPGSYFIDDTAGTVVFIHGVPTTIYPSSVVMTAQFESDKVFLPDGSSLDYSTTGPHVRFHGPSMIMAHGSSQAMAAISQTAAGHDFDFQQISVWATYTPRYLFLA